MNKPNHASVHCSRCYSRIKAGEGIRVARKTQVGGVYICKNCERKIMRTITVTVQGTWNAIKYFVSAIWQGWGFVKFNRVVKPTEYVIVMKPPTKAKHE